jgi:hypothetical protein
VGENRVVVYWVSVGKPEGKSPLGRTRFGWKDNIMLNLKNFGVDDIDCTGLLQDRDIWRAVTKLVKNLTFVRPCIVIYFYSNTNQKHNISNLFYFGTIVYMFRTVSPSITRSL